MSRKLCESGGGGGGGGGGSGGGSGDLAGGMTMVSVVF